MSTNYGKFNPFVIQELNDFLKEVGVSPARDLDDFFFLLDNIGWENGEDSLEGSIADKWLQLKGKKMFSGQVIEIVSPREWVFYHKMTREYTEVNSTESTSVTYRWGYDLSVVEFLTHASRVLYDGEMTGGRGAIGHVKVIPDKKYPTIEVSLK